MNNHSKRKIQRLVAGLLCAILIACGVALTLMSGAVPSAAQDASTPIPSPTDNGGGAAWTINASTAVLNYPKGGTFTLDIGSSGGDTRTATVYIYFSPTYRQRFIAKRDASTKAWVAEWSGQGVPPFANVTYYWIVSDAAGNVYQTDSDHLVYVDNNNEWRRVESADIIVYAEPSLPEDYLTQIEAAMEYRRPFFQQKWGTLLNYKPIAIIYDGYERWREWTPLIGRGNVGTGGQPTTFTVGRAYGDFGMFVGTANYNGRILNPRRMAFAIVLHEVGHLYQEQNGGILNGISPVWFSEGQAEYFVGLQAELDDSLDEVRLMAKSGTLPPLREIGRNGLLAYTVGVSFWIWLNEAYGEDIHLSVVQLLARGQNWQRALEMATNASFLDLEIQFRTWLGASNVVPPTALPSLTPPPFFATPTFPPTRTPTP